MSAGVGEGARVEALVAALRAEFPGLRLVDKQGDLLSRVLDVALRVVTLGGQAGYLDRYVTTLGRTIYLPAGFAARDERDRCCVLRHEAVHLRQFVRYGRLGMAALYLLPVLPLGLALGRARLEWEAYAETLRATAELRGPQALRDPALRAEIVRQFTGPAYGWMWPFPRAVGRWYDDEVERIVRSMDTRPATAGADAPRCDATSAAAAGPSSTDGSSSAAGPGPSAGPGSVAGPARGART
jgi:hypothetical protein